MVLKQNIISVNWWQKELYTFCLFLKELLEIFSEISNQIISISYSNVLFTCPRESEKIHFPFLSPQLPKNTTQTFRLCFLYFCPVYRWHRNWLTNRNATHPAGETANTKTLMNNHLNWNVVQLFWILLFVSSTLKRIFPYLEFACYIMDLDSNNI